jgi:hypothetical protein
MITRWLSLLGCLVAVGQAPDPARPIGGQDHALVVVSDAALEAAFRAGLAKDRPATGVICARGPYTMALQGPLNRAAMWAWERHQRLLPVTRADFPPELALPELRIILEPTRPVFYSGTGWSVPPVPEHVAIRSKAHREDVLQPLRIVREPRAWSSGTGQQLVSGALIAWYPLSGLPAGALELVAVTTNAQQSVCTIKDKDRLRIR